MKRTIALALAATALIYAHSASAENRCGWLQNPTPGNWWLTDSQGSWTIMTQGSYEADGMDLIGDISAHDYVANNGNYGYACACMDVMTNAAKSTITMIHSFRQLKLSECTKDATLPKPD